MPRRAAAPRRPVQNPRSMGARGNEALARGLAFEAPPPGEEPTHPVMLDWLANDTPETTAALRALLVAKGEPDADGWIRGERAVCAVVRYSFNPTAEHEAQLREALRACGDSADEIDRIVRAAQGGGIVPPEARALLGP